MIQTNVRPPVADTVRSTYSVTVIQSGLSQDIIESLRQDAIVTISGYFYAVDFGPDVRPQHHRMGKDKRCTCSLGEDCPAVLAVADYLKAGGERAPEPRAGYYPVAPQSCPICGAETYYYPELNSKRRGVGWACVKGRGTHYWLAHVAVLSKAFANNPWVYPPVYAADGTVLYPGLKREDVTPATAKPNWPEGYNPNL